jgi:hypothetical protein
VPIPDSLFSRLPAIDPQVPVGTPRVGLVSWRDEYRRCERCKSEYRPVRQAQSYCSRDCKRAAAYGRERFAAGTRGARRRRLGEASDKLSRTHIAGSVRNGHFSSIETIDCKPHPIWAPLTIGRDARSVGVGRCCLKVAFRVTCSASPYGNEACRASPEKSDSKSQGD